MNIKLNGKPINIPNNMTVKELVTNYLDNQDTKVAIAVNREVVPKSTWHSHKVNEGDVVEILTIAQGG